STLIKAAVFVVALASASCGYHLRGAAGLPGNLKVYAANASGPLREQLAKALMLSSGALVDSADQAGFVLQVVNERMQRRVITLSNTGKANEFELYYSLDFSVRDVGGKVLLDQQNIEISRDYFNDQEAIIAKSNEEDVIRREMYQQAVRAIFDRARARLAPN
ncbi:MAG: LPS-assembly lipoprotein LptE, partial [Gammaproteobacteria bacterium]